MRELVTSAGAQARLARAAQWLSQRGRSEQVLVVGATLEAASELIRAAAAPAAFGWQRVTLSRLA